MPKTDNMIFLKVQIRNLILIVTCVSLFSCATVSYSPYVSLDVSKKSINRSFVFEKFIDEIPESDKRNPFGGFALANENASSSNLMLEATRAIAYDFSTSGAFGKVFLQNDTSQYIVRGKFTRFLAKNRGTNFFNSVMISTLGMASIIFFFGIPVNVTKIDIVLTMSIYNRKTNQLVGTYSSEVAQTNRTSIYHNRISQILSLTNKNLSKAVLDIREQILRDADKY